MEHIVLVATGLYGAFRFINFTISTFRNVQYIKSGVQSHMQEQGINERDAMLFEHGYSNHADPINYCQTDACAALA